MERILISLFLCLISPGIYEYVNSARILGVFSIPSISHQVVFRALSLELAKRGHELVILTPNPAFPSEKSPDNITEIDTSESYQLIAQMMNEAKDQNTMKRGVIGDLSSRNMDELMQGMLYLVMYQFDMPVVKEFLEDKTQKFDLVIVEAIMNYPLIVGKIFNAPVIQFSSFYGLSENYAIMGGPAWHPLYYPNSFRRKLGDLNLWQKFQETYKEWKYYRINKKIEQIENNLLRNRYGPNAPTVDELQQSVHMLFLNAYPVIGNNRPVPPSVVYLGGLHLQPVKELPNDLQSYLDESKRGVIYVSLGTNVRPSMMDQDFLEAFLDAFKALPYDILWKFDGDKLDNVPKNVKIQKWFPQRDLLMHPKIKVFVTQGGLQSTDEAIDAGMPLVGIPILGDQWYNVNKYVELGIGVHVDAETMTAEDLVNGVNKVLGDDSYRLNMKRIREIINDQPQRPLDRAVWWVEHLLRHGGGRHLRAPSANKSWSEYYMLDVIAIVLGSFIVIFATALVICYKILNALKRKSIKPKQN